jgi:hypothetical protein
LVDARDLKSLGAWRCTGSIPVPGTIKKVGLNKLTFFYVRSAEIHAKVNSFQIFWLSLTLTSLAEQSLNRIAAKLSCIAVKWGEELF